MEKTHVFFIRVFQETLSKHEKKYKKISIPS